MAQSNDPPPSPEEPADPNLPYQVRDLLAAESVRNAVHHVAPSLTAADVREALNAARAVDRDGSGTLYHQGQTLDALFHRLCTEGTMSTRISDGSPVAHITESYLELALRMQRESRRAIETLARIRHLQSRLSE